MTIRKNFFYLLFVVISLNFIIYAYADENFTTVIIDSAGPEAPWLKSCGDLDNDGFADIIIGGHISGGLVWYKYPGWDKYIISTEKFSTDGEVADINRDGYPDIVVVENTSIKWFENPGPDFILSSGKWKQTTIANIKEHDVEIADFDLDGDIDVIARDQGNFGHSGATLFFIRQENPEKWTIETIICPDGEGLLAMDVDRDNDMDIVINLCWFENPGRNVSGTWEKHTYTHSYTHPSTFIASGDINNDGRDDLVLSPSELKDGIYRISWFEAPPDPKKIWEEHIIKNNIETVHHFVGVADFNNDGQEDVASAEMTQGSGDDEVKIYINSDKGGAWTKQILSVDGSHSMRIVDIENDGDFDLFGANWRANGRDEYVKLWLNNRIKKESPKQ